MRILVTRPEPAASRTAETVRALGHDPVILPLSVAVPDIAAARAALRRPHGAIALTSAQAAAVLAEVAEDLAPHLATPVFAVGRATAQAVRTLGFYRVTIGPGDGEGLARAIADIWPLPRSPRLLYLAGNPRSPGFEQALARHAITVSTVECYRMLARSEPATLAAILAGPDAPTAILLYSPESARHCLAMLSTVPRRLWPAAAFCLSPAVAAMFADFQGTIHTASKPDEASLLALLPPAG